MLLMEEDKGLQQCRLVMSLARLLGRSLARDLGRNLARDLGKKLGKK
jgi:hypothetical protein